MHACHQQFVVLCIFQDAYTRSYGLLLVHVKVCAELRMRDLQSCTMHQVTDDEEILLLKGGVARSMANCVNGYDTMRQGIAELEQVKMLLIDCHSLLLHLGSLFRHLIDPRIIFTLCSINLGVRKYRLTLMHHTADVIAMEMSDIENRNAIGWYAQGVECRDKLASAYAKTRVKECPLAVEAGRR